MLPQTDLNPIKAKTKLFLMFDLQPVENFPFIVKHPFTDSNYTLDQSTGTLVNLASRDRSRQIIAKQHTPFSFLLYSEIDSKDIFSSK